MLLGVVSSVFGSESFSVSDIELTLKHESIGYEMSDVDDVVPGERNSGAIAR